LRIKEQETHLILQPRDDDNDDDDDDKISLRSGICRDRRCYRNADIKYFRSIVRPHGTAFHKTIMSISVAVYKTKKITDLFTEQILLATGGRGD
jgi:hypothetical protein